MTPRRFAQLTFGIAGVYGLLVTLPLYGMEARIGHDAPPPITHPEYFYGFTGVVVAWQLAFLLVARDPARLRVLMPVGVVEKLAFGVPALLLYAQHRLSRQLLGFGIIDLVLGALFVTAFVVTKPADARA